MIEIKNIDKKFKQKEIFNNFSASFKAGKIITIMGPSGCGKSTLLNMIGGLEKPDHGSIIIDNKEVNSYKNNSLFRDKVSYLFQNFALVENKTIYQNMQIALGNKVSKEEISDKLKELNLNVDVNTPVYMLSGGEQQRVSMMRILLKDNPIILADEPTGSLDPKNRDVILDLLVKQKEKGKLIIIVTHDPFIESISDEIIKL